MSEVPLSYGYGHSIPCCVTRGYVRVSTVKLDPCTLSRSLIWGKRMADRRCASGSGLWVRVPLKWRKICQNSEVRNFCRIWRNVRTQKFLLNLKKCQNSELRNLVQFEDLVSSRNFETNWKKYNSKGGHWVSFWSGLNWVWNQNWEESKLVPLYISIAKHRGKLRWKFRSVICHPFITDNCFV